MDVSNRPQGTHATAAAGEHISRDEDALRRCTLSNSLFKTGDYEGAVEALEDFWRGACERPAAEGLGARAAGELLVHAGRLTSALGDARRIEGAQEAAKNLISEGAGIFERLGDARQVAEARSDLGLCYWREGANDEARVVLRAAVEGLTQEEAEPKAVALIRLAVVEVTSKRYEASLALLDEAAPLVEASGNEGLRGCLHTERAITYRGLADAGDAEMLDRAFVEYAAASHCYELVGNARHQARVENNLGHLFGKAGRYEEAHEHLKRARALYASLDDTQTAARCDDTLARVLTTEGIFDEAEAAALSAVRALEAGGGQSLLAEALTTLGVAQARGGREEEARLSLTRAAEVAEVAGDRTGAGLAALTLVEELGEWLSHAELCAAFRRADETLSGTRNPDTLLRLTACARRAIESFMGLYVEDGPPEERWEGFSLKAEVLRYEAELIKRALRDADGVVSHAAKLLGFKHHQTFVALLNNRHKGLLGERRPVVPRRRSVFRRPRRQAQHAGKKG